MAADPLNSPLMLQYRDIKSRHQDAILFFRMGDFYEMFFDDAERAAQLLGITLTSRGDGIPLAGVPVKAAADYLRQLVGAGLRVAICEQVEDPKQAKGIVRREVIETITPGALLEEGWLAGARNNYLVAVGGAAGLQGSGAVGLAAVDLSTGEFLLETLPPEALSEALSRLAPAEVASPADVELALDDDVMRTARERWEFDPALAREELARRFNLASLDGLGLGPADDPAIGAAGALLRYLSELQPGGLKHLARPTVRRSDGHLWIDEMTRRNLELVEPLRAGARGVTLLETIDATVTPMGARLLRAWLLNPLSDRHGSRSGSTPSPCWSTTPAAAPGSARRSRGCATSSGWPDAPPPDARPRASSAPSAIRSCASPTCSKASGASRAGTTAPHSRPPRRPSISSPTWDSCSAPPLEERPPATLAEGGVIRRGYDAELDESRDLRDGGKQYIAGLQQRERERTGIPSLKVGYNKVFGYYLEVTHAHTSRVPADYERRQTLTGAERYVTPELKEYESKVLSAEERMHSREAELVAALRDRVGGDVTRIQRTAQLLARLDVWSGLAERAVHGRYVRPVMTAGFELSLTASRHAVIERMMPREAFMPNDVRFTESERVLLVTGPNMAGKSTILRQIGLCVVLAQMGAFVPADAAEIGIVDRLFTRVGASDNLAQGQSTFMVEMAETSAILHNATRASLVLLDEIGRGTSTYDGVAIAWAVSEHLHDQIGCKTMFATHYHELMQLPERLAHARNLNVAVRETGETVVFLHRLEAGGTDRSYGVHVAQLAGLPDAVVARARAVLTTLEGTHRVVQGPPPPEPDPTQLPLFVEAAPHPALEALRAMDVSNMTPLEALNRLAELQGKAGTRGRGDVG